jgi:DNA-binding MarR family transcriptional regulator
MKPENKENPLGAELKRTVNALQCYISSYVSSHIREDITAMEGMTLGYFFRHSDQKITAKDIIRHSHVSKATVSANLNSLMRKGFLRMVTDPKDKRSKAIVLTKKGKETNAEFDRLFHDINAEIEKGFSADEKQSFRAYLERIRANIGCPNPEEEHGPERDS